MYKKTKYPSVYLRYIKKNGEKSYCYRIRDKNDKQITISGFRTAKEAHGKRIKILNQIKERTYIEVKLNVSQLCERYLNYKKKRIKESSMRALSDAIYKRIIPEIGDLKLESLESEDIENMMENIASGVSKKRANSILKHLSALIDFGVNRRKIAYNPAKAIDYYKVRKATHNVLSWSEVLKLLDTCPEDAKVKCALAALAGLRRGEVFGLEWKNVDFKEHFIYVRKQLQDGIVKDPKTENAVRDVPMLDLLENMLREWGQNSKHLGYLFVHGHGKRQQAEYWTKVVFPKLVKEASITPVTFHELRHTFGTLCAAKGVPVQDTAKYMGHSNIQITYRYYYHPSNEDKLKGMAPLNSFCSQNVHNTGIVGG